MLSTQFNLQSKTKTELQGLYIELFNRLADQNATPAQRKNTHAMMYLLRTTFARLT